MTRYFVRDRTQALLEEINFTGKEILELGCAGMGKYDIYTQPHWFHKNVKRISKSIIGMDKNEQMLRTLRLKGYSVIDHDLNKPFSLKKKFDIITANEVLEHLSDPAECLRSVKRHLKEKGIFVITTPNPWSGFFYFQTLFLNRIRGVSLQDHKFWWDRWTVRNFLETNGFEIIKMWFVYPKHMEHPLLDALLFKPIAWLLPRTQGRNLCIITRRKV